MATQKLKGEIQNEIIWNDYDYIIKNKKNIEINSFSFFDLNINIINIVNNKINGNKRKLTVCPCFSGKTYLMMTKILSSELNNPGRKLTILTRYPNQNLD